MPLCSCNFYAHTLGICVGVLVYIPSPRRTDAARMSLGEIYAPGKKHRTLYLLHGMYEDETCWLRRSNIERYAEERQIAVVMPRAENSFYADMEHGGDYFTFLTQELPLFARSVFPLSDRREDNYIAGLSMGGYGAAHAALACPRQYAAFASLSGAVDLEEVLGRIGCDEERRLFEDVFGSPERARRADLFPLAQKLKASGGPMPDIYLACGAEDRLCYPMNASFRSRLGEAGIACTYEEGPGGHDWTFWDIYIRRVLDWLDRREQE